MHGRTVFLARVAEQAVRTLERRRCAYVRRRHGRRLDAPENFTLVCDASRLPFLDLVEVLLTAATVELAKYTVGRGASSR